MRSITKWSRVVPLAWLAASVVGTAPAHAANLFDMLFGGGIKQRPSVDAPPIPMAGDNAGKKPANASRTAKSANAPSSRIDAPSYYTYKADPLVRVDLAALAKQETTITPIAFKPAGDDFGQALAAQSRLDLFAEKDVAKALADHYTVDPKFVWVTDGAPNAKAVEAIRVLSDAETQGLDPRDYSVDVPTASGLGAGEADHSLLAFELTLSARVLRYVRDANLGRVDPNRISGYYDFAPKPIDLAAALNAVETTSDLPAYLNDQNPQSPDFRALRDELAALHENDEADTIAIDPKLRLKPGQSSPEFSKLLAKISRNLDDEMGGEFGELLMQQRGSELYSDALKPVIQAVQKRAGLQADGIIGPRTVALFTSESKEDRIAKVRIALEQMRWLPREFGSPRVFINQPAFTASYIKGNEAKVSMRVVVGSPTTQTSFFYDEIESVDYNPYWGVPQSIIVNEMLPRLRRDPGYLDRAGYEVTNAKGKRVPSSSVDWGSYGTKIPFNVRQSPSEANALGELKILFPNKHAIYMHDTPSKSFFARDMRALSHGCIRLQDPRAMAAAVLGTSLDHVVQKLGQGHSSEKLTTKIPVYVAYFTAWPTTSGKVEYFNDVYGRDERLRLALDATEATRIPSM